jgi:hypothetical protein
LKRTGLPNDTPHHDVCPDKHEDFGIIREAILGLLRLWVRWLQELAVGLGLDALYSAVYDWAGGK